MFDFFTKNIRATLKVIIFVFIVVYVIFIYAASYCGSINDMCIKDIERFYGFKPEILKYEQNDASGIMGFPFDLLSVQKSLVYTIKHRDKEYKVVYFVYSIQNAGWKFHSADCPDLK